MTDIHQQIVGLLPRLRRFARGLTGSVHDGDDLVQSTCEKALKKLETFEAGTKLDSWMYRIAQNLWIDQIRSNKLKNNVVELAVVDQVSAEDPSNMTIESLHEVQNKLSLVEQAMQKLPDEQRCVLALVCIEGCSYNEAASIMNIPKGTVMSRLARARQQLYKHLAAQLQQANLRVQ